MKFIPLASSSAGNAYLVDDGESLLMIECGVSYKKLRRLTGFGTTGVSGCLLSHEHHDHAGCFLQLLKNGVPVYASEGTAVALDCTLLDPLKAGTPVTVGGYDILPFPTFHDAAEPLGFLIRSRADGEKLAFATDTVNMGYQFPGLHIVAVECNYDEAILAKAERMPEKVRYRVQNSHMSVTRVCEWLKKLDMSHVREVYLMHLSDACSSEDGFQRMVQAVCPPHVRVMVCPKEAALPPSLQEGTMG